MYSSIERRHHRRIPWVRLLTAAGYVAGVTLLLVAAVSAWLAYQHCTIPLGDSFPPIPGKCGREAHQMMAYTVGSLLLGGLVTGFTASARRRLGRRNAHRRRSR